MTSIFLVYPDRAAIRHSKPAVKSVMTHSSHKRSEIGVDYAMSNISGAQFSAAAKRFKMQAIILHIRHTAAPCVT